ncbi:hypothetical protein Hanom_Chr06g00502181 [Helianthus anomalus]
MFFWAQFMLVLHFLYDQSTKITRDTEHLHCMGEALLEIRNASGFSKNAKQPIKIYLNCDVVAHSPTKDRKTLWYIESKFSATSLLLDFC